MSVATAKVVIERFITTPQEKVLALKGPWGAGKTFAWRQLIEECKSKLVLPRYSYVSLFGVSSLVDLRNVVIAKTQPKAQIGRKLDLKNINENWRDLGEKSFRNLYGLLHASSLPYIRDLVAAGDTFAPFAIRDTLICFDDFERISSANLKPEDVLGFASQLKEERGCKIAFIFNEDELPQKEIYKKYREKLVDVELTYSPTAREAAEIAIPRDLMARKSVVAHTEFLGITNIRILSKIVKNIRLLAQSLHTFHSNVFLVAEPMIVLLTWAYFDSSPDHPSIEYISTWNSFAAVAGREQEQHADWAALLQKYGMNGFDELDKEILEVIKKGFVEDTALLLVAEKRHDGYMADDLTAKFSAAWDKFHGSFEDNEETVIAELAEAFKQAVFEISPPNLNGLVVLLRELGRDGLADQLIDFYVNARREEVGLFNLRDSVFGADVTDETIIEVFEKAAMAHAPSLSLLETLKEMAKRKSWSREELEVVSAASPADFREVFIRSAGRELRRIVRTCLMFNAAPHASIARNATTALEELAALSKINRSRVRRLGIPIDPE